MVEQFANSGDTDQMLQSMASDLSLHCLPVTNLGVASLQWVKQSKCNSNSIMLENSLFLVSLLRDFRIKNELLYLSSVYHFVE